MRATTPSKIGMAPPHPRAFIRDEILDELGLSVSAAAKALGVRRATLSDLLNGNAALSAEMALRVEKAFGVDMETLLRMQAWHDAVAMRRRQIGVKRYRVAVLKLAGSPKVTRGRLLRPPPKVTPGRLLRSPAEEDREKRDAPSDPMLAPASQARAALAKEKSLGQQHRRRK
jgi:addiction module HigA family antidote